ncbi:hypothetical protein EUBDOL_02247 [Amedibacillus dolichus DSM 3991]|uniref:Uncharacterized protein n=1 Tax=Amedibacillus dolichus DSM 3991 TaxID=428127 RepID=A8RFH9_9FIRM|nr:hypothetical protein EUBDOL_02247 [Amedibacillus dolichus DSM 3991]
MRKLEVWTIFLLRKLDIIYLLDYLFLSKNDNLLLS